MNRIAFVLLLAGTVLYGQSIVTRAGDNFRTGVYTETTLTPANVAAQGLRVIFNLPMEGDARGIEAQPLALSNVLMQDGQHHNILIHSAMNNLVWCYDTDNSKILWVQNAGNAISGGPSIDFWGINDHWGFLSTGVIDVGTSTWYGVSWVSPDGTPAKGKHFLVGLKLADGSQAFPPVAFPAAFDAVMRKQRSSLAIGTFGGRTTILGAAGTVLETSSTAAGYLFAFDVGYRTFTVLPMAEAGGGAGVWMGGSGLVIDASNNIYGVSGNGTFNPASGDWAETVFRAQYTPPNGPSANGVLSIQDWWTPYTDNWRSENSPNVKVSRLAGHSASTAAPMKRDDEGRPVNGEMFHDMPKGAAMGDEDLGSAPCNLIPVFSELLCAGKDSIGLVVNTLNMGKTQPADLSTAAGIAANYAKLMTPPFWYGTYAGNGVSADPTNAQALNNNVWFDLMTNHVHFGSVVMGDLLFVGAENSNVRAWRANADHTFTYLANSDDVASPDLAATPPGGMTGWALCGTSSGLLIAIRPHGDANKSVTQGDVFIFDALNYGTRPDGTKQLKVLWRSDMPGLNLGKVIAPIVFDFNKFDVPIVFQGKIYIPTYNGNTGTLALGLN